MAREDEPNWLVALEGQPTPMSLDQLDEAFRKGTIDESTLVWSPGMLDWRALGEVLGADSDEEDLKESRALAEPARESMEHDEMPKVDPRLWTLSDDARAARRSEAKHVDAIDDDPSDEMELGAEDLDDDETPLGGAPPKASLAAFTPGLAIPSAPWAASKVAQSVPPGKVAQSVPPGKAAPTVPPRSASMKTLPPRSASAQSVPPSRASAASRVPPPPRSRSLPPAPKAFESLPPPVLNISTLESTAPLVRTLSEPVIPIQPPPPGWNWRPWAAAAGAVFGMSMYGLSVLDLAASSSDGPKREATVVAAEPLPAPPSNLEAPPAARESASRSSSPGDTPVTAAVMPRGAQAVSDDVPALAAESDRSALVTPSRKATKKSSRFSKKKKRSARSKASAKSNSKKPAWLSKFKTSAR